MGASGDLAPLAHMSLLLLGEGKARYQGEWLPAHTALAQAGLQPLTLAAKEGLALLNGTQVSAAYALRGLFEAEDLYAAASVFGCLTVDAALDPVAHLTPVFTPFGANVGRLMLPALIVICLVNAVKSQNHTRIVTKCRIHILYAVSHR